MKAVTAWPANDRMSTGPFFILQKTVNEKMKDKVRIEYLGGPEVVASFDLIEAVKTGVVDVASLSAAYYMRVMPESAVLNLSQFNHRGLRQSGFHQAFLRHHPGISPRKQGGTAWRIFFIRWS